MSETPEQEYQRLLEELDAALFDLGKTSITELLEQKPQ